MSAFKSAAKDTKKLVGIINKIESTAKAELATLKSAAGDIKKLVDNINTQVLSEITAITKCALELESKFVKVSTKFNNSINQIAALAAAIQDQVLRISSNCTLEETCRLEKIGQLCKQIAASATAFQDQVSIDLMLEDNHTLKKIGQLCKQYLRDQVPINTAVLLDLL